MFLGLALPSTLQAEDTSKIEDEKEAEVIVVVGKTTNTEITPNDLEKYQANDMADIFRTIPSVTVGGSTGIAQKVYIRGLEDTFLNVTVDGAPQTGTLFHHIGRISIDPELLQAVEVQAGAGEATSGIGAIGGAIRFKTKSANDLLEQGESFGGLFKTNYFSNNGHKNSLNLYGKLSDNWGLIGSYVHTDRDNMEDGNGNVLEATAADQKLAFIKTSGRFGDNHSISLSYEKRQEKGNFSQKPNFEPQSWNKPYPMEGERSTIVFNHNYSSGNLLNLETTIYDTSSEISQNIYDKWGIYYGSVESRGFDFRNTSKFTNHTLTYGIEHKADTSNSAYLSDPSIWQPLAWDPNLGAFQEKGKVTALYIQNHWQANPELLVSFGLRYDNYELEQVTYNNAVKNSGVSPNIGFTYEMDENWILTMGYAQAMRGKEVGDAFTLERKPGTQDIAPNLKAEEVDNTEIGIEYIKDNFQFTASVYQTHIDNVINNQIGGGSLYENVGELKTNGFEMKATYWWDALNLTASYSNNESKLNGNILEGYEQTGLGNARGDTWGLDLNYNLSEDLKFGWNFSYVESLKNIEVFQRVVAIGWAPETLIINKPSYSFHDVYMQWQPNDSISVNLAVHNVFDEYYLDHSSIADYDLYYPNWGVSGVYEAGRDIRLGVSFKF